MRSPGKTTNVPQAGFASCSQKYKEVELLVKIGEFQSGKDALADEAIARVDQLNAFLKQGLYERSTFEETLAHLEEVTAG